MKLLIDQIWFRLLGPLVYGFLLYILIMVIPNSFDYLGEDYLLRDQLGMSLLALLLLEGQRIIFYFLERRFELEANTYLRIFLQLGLSFGLALGLAELMIRFEFHQVMEKLHLRNINSTIESFTYSLHQRIRIIFMALTALNQLLLLAHYFFILFQRNALESERLRKETAFNQLQTLKNKIQPHFWFACLEKLRDLVPQSPEASEHFIKQLSLFYRYSLNHSDRELISLEEELKFVANYLFLLNTGPGNCIQLEQRIDEKSQSKLLPSRILQKLIENLTLEYASSPARPLKILIESQARQLSLGYEAQEKLIPLTTAQEDLIPH
ncbi:MAG: histidine kinase, partial [Bacteroidota bacterium]